MTCLAGAWSTVCVVGVGWSMRVTTLFVVFATIVHYKQAVKKLNIQKRGTLKVLWRSAVFQLNTVLPTG